MRNTSIDDEKIVNCDCDIQIRTFPNRIEYWDKKNGFWQALYPPFRLYKADASNATLLAADSKNLTFSAGCSVSIDGTVYTDYNELIAALEVSISFFFSQIVVFDYGTTLERPTNPAIAQPYYDTDLGYPIFWDGTNWKNFNGAIVP